MSIGNVVHLTTPKHSSQDYTSHSWGALVVLLLDFHPYSIILQSPAKWKVIWTLCTMQFMQRLTFLMTFFCICSFTACLKWLCQLIFSLHYNFCKLQVHAYFQTKLYSQNSTKNANTHICLNNPQTLLNCKLLWS